MTEVGDEEKEELIRMALRLGNSGRNQLNEHIASREGGGRAKTTQGR